MEWNGMARYSMVWYRMEWNEMEWHDMDWEGEFGLKWKEAKRNETEQNRKKSINNERKNEDEEIQRNGRKIKKIKHDSASDKIKLCESWLCCKIHTWAYVLWYLYKAESANVCAAECCSSFSYSFTAVNGIHWMFEFGNMLVRSQF